MTNFCVETYSNFWGLYTLAMKTKQSNTKTVVPFSQLLDVDLRRDFLRIRAGGSRKCLSTPPPMSGIEARMPRRRENVLETL